jgi:hypothetical protein
VTRKPKDAQASESQSDFKSLMRRAEKGDEAALEALKTQIAPDGWRRLADLVFNAEYALIKRYAGESLVIRESANAQLAHMKAELGGSNPTPLERLLVDRIALLWLQLTYYETIYTQNMSELSIRQADYHQRRIDGTNRRYLAAIRTLAQVRRLALPIMQVNIGEKQLNVAAPMTGIPVPSQVTSS